ncbi:GTPase [Actinoplanes sp. CA-252034]|uniref:GTPase n=1 Tax=Actinoplanes sp. CA-252034 TaxID=3239906 RepID=UPI003D95630E
MDDTAGLARWLGEVIDDLARSMRASVPRGRATAADEGVEELWQRLDGAVEEVLGRLGAVVAAQMSTIDRFTIAFFGRTNVGKSTTIEALAGGSGLTVSDGSNDFTRHVSESAWSHCVLLDMPGINGWGGNGTDREKLEREARRGVEQADLVVLCFEDAGQHEMDFAKVSQWVAEFGKPSVALLNVKTMAWRMPPRKAKRADRQTLSRAVAEHDGRIRDELTAMGLPGVPIIAISANLGFLAQADPARVRVNARRARDHADRLARSDAADSELKQAIDRADALDELAGAAEIYPARYGRQRLRRWSNLDAFALLVITALNRHARSLRLHRLFRDVHGALGQADAVFAEAIQSPALELATPVRTALQSMADLLGPELLADADVAAAFVRLADHRVRIALPEIGSAQRYADNLVSSSLAPLREAARQRADEAIADAMRERRDLDGERFTAEVFQPDALVGKQEEILRTLGAYLADSLGSAVEDLDTELEVIIEQGSRVDGEAGRTLQRIGTGMAIGGIVVGLLALATPVGWAGLAVGLVGVGVRTIARHLRRKGAAERLAAQTNAWANGRKQVDDTFDSIAAGIHEWFAERRAEAVRETVRPAAERLLALYDVAGAAAYGRALIDLTVDQMRNAENVNALARLFAPPQIMAEATRLAEERARMGGPSLWLGESWIDDPDGLEVGETRERTRPRRRRPIRPRARPIAGLVDRLTASPRPGSGARWLHEVAESLRDEPEFAADLRRLKALALGPPRLAFCGDYSTGKSSLIRRLLVDSELPIPPGLEIRADPTTTHWAEYPWLDVVLVDTPGLRSGKAEHDERAREALTEAAGVLFLFDNDLMTDAPEGVAEVARERALYVINRADRLGDPVDDPRTFGGRVRRKRAELRDALAAHGADVPIERIFCVASDPSGLAGSRTDVDASHFDRFRDWDGLADVAEALTDLRATVLVNGVDVTVFSAGIERLRGRRARLGDALRLARRQEGQHRRLREDLERRVNTGEAIAADWRSRLRHQLTDFAGRLVAEAVAETDEERRAIRADRLAHFAADPGTQSIIADWSRDVADDVERWRAETHDIVQERMRHRAFAAAFTDGGGLDVTVFRRYRTRHHLTEAARFGSILGELAIRYGTREIADATAQQLRSAANWSGFGAGLQSALALADAVNLYRELRQEETQARERLRLRDEAVQLARQLADRCIAANAGLQELHRLLSLTAERARERGVDEEAARTLVGRIEDLIAVGDEHITNAEKKLGTKGR